MERIAGKDGSRRDKSKQFEAMGEVVSLIDQSRVNAESYIHTKVSLLGSSFGIGNR